MVRVLDDGVRDGSIRVDLGNRLVVATVLWGFTHGVIQVASIKAKLLAHQGVDGRALLDEAMAMATRSVAAKV